MIYEVYATHVHDHETQIKKYTLYFLKSVSFMSNDSFTNNYLKYS